jgi:hypothetical protein
MRSGLNESTMAGTASVSSGILYVVAPAPGLRGMPTTCATSMPVASWLSTLGAGTSAEVRNVDVANRRTVLQGQLPTTAQTLDIFEV